MILADTETSIKDRANKCFLELNRPMREARQKLAEVKKVRGYGYGKAAADPKSKVGAVAFPATGLVIQSAPSQELALAEKVRLQ